MTNALLLVVLGVAQGNASDIAFMRGHRRMGFIYAVSSAVSAIAASVLILSEVFS